MITDLKYTIYIIAKIRLKNKTNVKLFKNCMLSKISFLKYIKRV